MDTFVLMNKCKNSQTTLTALLLPSHIEIYSLNYHPTKFGSKFRMDLDRELLVECNYRKTLFILRIHTPNA